MSGHAWYGCYGSNLAWARFRCYLEGGAPPGAAATQPGCRDASPPSGDRPVWLPGQVYFAHHAPSWGGGVAFLDTSSAARSPGRAYRVTLDQLADVTAQENRLAPGSLSFDVEHLVAARGAPVCAGWYGTVAPVGSVDGEPLLTITSGSPSPTDPAALSAPSLAYLRTIAGGLAETHGWPAATIAEHLHACPGVAPTWSTTALTELGP